MIRISQIPASTAINEPRPTAGKWIVWDRDQTRVIAVGGSFDQAKQAAAVTGESSVILAHMVPGRDGQGERPLYSVAVFISPTPAALNADRCGCFAKPA